MERSPLRWHMVALFFLATAISYIDRQTLAVVAPILRDEFGLSNFGYARIVFAFLLAYTFMQPVNGWLVDRLGTRRGFALIMVWWSAAAALHAAGQGVRSFSVFRILLGAGEAGSFAACVRGVAEWFPREERGLANGIWGAGTSFGLIVTVPLVVWITGAYGWRAAFLFTGATGFAWVAAWLWLYPAEANRPTMTGAEVDGVGGAAEVRSPGPTSFRSLLTMRRLWALMLARFCVDPIVWFYNAWVPEYLKRSGGFSMIEIGRYGWIPFAAQFVGIMLGGVLSDALCRRGRRVIDARMVIMLCGVLLMTAGFLVAYPIHIAVSLAAISLSTFGFGLWAPNMMSLCADAFGARLAGSVTGLTGIGAGLGGMIYTLFTGWMLDHFGYKPVFISASVLPLVAFAVLYVLMDSDRVSPTGARFPNGPFVRTS